MFENVGGKIQGMAKVLCWMCIISDIVIGIYLITLSFDMIDGNLYAAYDGILYVALGVGVLLAGPFVSWVNGLILYGFGLLVEKYADNSNKVSVSQQSNTPKKEKTESQESELKTYKELCDIGAITKEEYEKIKNRILNK